jgi:hypothetical protein
MRRILVVDDDLHTRLALRIWLRQGAFRGGLRCRKAVTQGFAALAGIMPAAAVASASDQSRGASASNQKREADRFALMEERWRN